MRHGLLTFLIAAGASAVISVAAANKYYFEPRFQSAPVVHYTRNEKIPCPVQQQAVVAPRNMDFNDLTPANKLMLLLPPELPGAREVQKSLAPRASIALCVIKQDDTVAPPNRTEKIYRAQVQEDIYRILLELKKRNVLNHNLYSEGVFKENESLTNLKLKLPRVSPAQKNSLEAQINLLESYFVRQANDVIATKLLQDKFYAKLANSSLNNPITEYPKGLDEQLFSGALYKLAKNSSTTVRAAEDIEHKLKADFAVHAYTTVDKTVTNEFLLTKAIFDDRENLALWIIAAQDNREAILLYGAKHAFAKESMGSFYNPNEVLSGKDVLGDWNKMNPERQFSLCIITPEHYVFRP